MKRLALFASGTGTNALRLLEAAKSLEGIKITHLIVDTTTSPLPEHVAEQYPQTQVHRLLPDPGLKGSERKQEFEGRILKLLREGEVEWILLAGYMRLIGPGLLEAYENRIINIHPSLLPLYPGLHAYERAYQDQVSQSGITLHFVDGGMDTGPIILQKPFPRFPADSLSDFIQRGKELEWQLYPEILKLIQRDQL